MCGSAAPATPRPALPPATAPPVCRSESPFDGVTGAGEKDNSSVVSERKRNKVASEPAAPSAAHAGGATSEEGTTLQAPLAAAAVQQHAGGSAEHVDVGTEVHPDDLTPADKIAAMFSAKFKPPPPLPEGVPEPRGSAAGPQQRRRL